MKIIILLIILTMPLTLAAEISISPASINFIGETGKEICNKIILSGEGFLEGEDRWADRPSKNILDYKLKPNEITIDYPKSLRLSGDKKIQVCINATISGKYYGALIYSQNSAAVGT